MCWISMLFHAKRILVEYKSMVMRMFDEQTSNTIAKWNIDLSCGVETFLKSKLYDTFAWMFAIFVKV
jgi:hypothetical protein